MKFIYRDEIDGLRAIAVLSVVFYHAGFSYFSGGFVGVDIFFVISGYLIGNIILKEILSTRFSFLNFYNRRARRLLPVLLFIILFSNIFAFIFLSMSELSEYLKSSLSGIFFYSNFFFWKNAPYFSIGSELKPLLHLWSLSIEEQFYIVFPFLMIFLIKYKTNVIYFILILFFFLSLGLSEWGSDAHKVANFYLPFTRAWEILIGVITALYLNNNNTKYSQKIRDTIVIISLIGIALSFLLFNNNTPVPSSIILIPTISTMLIIIFLNKECIIYKALSYKPLVCIGLMSYSIYLWHQPIFAFSKYFIAEINLLVSAILILLTLFFSLISWKYIEIIFRNKNKINNKKFILIGTVAIIFLTLNGMSFIYFNNNSDEKNYAIKLSKNEAIYLPNFDDRKFIKNRIFYERRDFNSIAIGSSRIMGINDNLDDNQILNLGVNGASLEDIVVFTIMSMEKLMPSKIYIGLDPWLFNKNNSQKRWRSLKQEFKVAERMIYKNKYSTLFFNDDKSKEINNSFIGKTLDKLYRSVNVRRDNIIADLDKAYDGNRSVIKKDGRRFKSNIEKFEPGIINYSMKNFEFSRSKFELFEKFIKYILKNSSSEIIFILTPYEYSSYMMTIKENPNYEKSEELFLNFAKKYGINIIGSYNLKNTSCENSDFLDNYHPNDNCMNKLIINKF